MWFDRWQTCMGRMHFSAGEMKSSRSSGANRTPVEKVPPLLLHRCVRGWKEESKFSGFRFTHCIIRK